MTNIILCGGSGTRLWPISRTLMPKQFVKLLDNKSLFQLTLKRNAKVCDKQLIVSSTEQYFLALDQLEEYPQFKNSQFLLEPLAKNTAPAIALACMALDPDELVLVTPSDHLIKNETAYQEAVIQAKELALEDKLVTFGITPDSPQTGFGYIEANGNDVTTFHEKPNLDIAKKYLQINLALCAEHLALKYYWNSGIFCFKAGVFLQELQTHAPQIFEACKKALGTDASASAKSSNKSTNNNLPHPIRIKHDYMYSIPEDSIDYAVMEKSSKVKVIPADIDWSDLGSFDALYDELPKDQNGNTSNKNHIAIDSKNNLIYGNERKIATVDIEDLIIVDTGDALLISKKGSSQKVKKVVEAIKEDTQLHNIHLTAHRPWGTYTVLEDQQGYKIKTIKVNPGKRLSLQKHLHRSEHWIVVSGTATVTVGDKKEILRKNESTYIKIGELHRLENEGKLPLIMIEAQVGDYTQEDDIIRIESDYNDYQ